VSRALLALPILVLSACATPAGTNDRSRGWFCSAEANSGQVHASSHRELDFQGGPREGRSEFDLTLAGNQPARLLADWEGSRLPKIAEGRYRFRMSRHVVPAEPGQLQLVIGNAVAARSGWSPGLAELTVSGRDIGPQLLSGAAMGLRLVAPDGRSLGSVGVDRESFDLAVQLARQANAAVLAKASDFRNQCQREEKIIVT
jgi:hypothetical protein